MLHKEILYPDLEKQIREIYKTHTIPTYTPGDWNLKRWQRKEWPSALNFNFGDGRYIPYGFQDASRRQGNESPGA